MKKKSKLSYRFEVIGHPTGRREPLWGHRHSYPHPKTVAYYDLIRKSFLAEYKKLDDKDHEWRLEIDIYVKGKQFADCSNIIKAVEDSLQSFLWHNDKQIAITSGTRLHVAKDEQEFIVVHAETIDE